MLLGEDDVVGVRNSLNNAFIKLDRITKDIDITSEGAGKRIAEAAEKEANRIRELRKQSN